MDDHYIKSTKVNDDNNNINNKIASVTNLDISTYPPKFCNIYTERTIV